MANDQTENLMLNDVDDLERFFTHLSSIPTESQYAGLDFEVFPVGPKNLLMVSLLAPYYAVHDRIAGRKRGTHVRVHLPGTLGLDLRLESRLRSVGGDDPLLAAYTFSATNEEKVRELISGEVLSLFLSLALVYRVSMSDDWIQFGPLRATARESAVFLDSLCKVIGDLAGDTVTGRSGVAELGDEIAVAAATRDKTEAEVMRAALEAAGIPCILDGYERSSPWGPGLANPSLKIKVKVKQEDEERAREVLGAHEEEELPAEDRMPVTPVMERSKDPVWTVLAGLVAIFASLVWLTGFRPLGDPSPLDRLVELGALEGWPPAAEGYRLITMNFLHLDWLHLLTNIEGLILFGWAAVRLFGLGQTALVYALAALASGLSTALFLEPVVAVGASGCVFALTFMTLAGLLRLALSVTVARWRALIRVVGWALFMIPPAFYFNWAAHLSGALIGLLLGFLLPLAPMEPHTAFRNRGRVLGILGGLILAVPWLWCLILGA